MTVVLFGKKEKIASYIELKSVLGGYEDNFTVSTGCFLNTNSYVLTSVILENTLKQNNSSCIEQSMHNINSLSFLVSKDIFITNKIGEDIFNDILIKSSFGFLNDFFSISGELSPDVKTHPFFCINQIGANLARQFPFFLVGELADILSKDECLVSSVDVYSHYILSILNDFDLRKEKNFIYVSEYDPIYLDGIDVRVLLDGEDISNYITEIDINLFDIKTILPSITINFAGKNINRGETIEIFLNNNRLEFLGEEFEYNKKNFKGSIWGRSKMALKFYPYCPAIEYKFEKTTVNEIIHEVLNGEDIVYNIDDWNIDSLHETSNPLELCSKIVNSCGGVFVGFPDNRIYCFYPGNCPAIPVEGDVITDFSFSEKKGKYRGVQVRNREAGPIVIETDKSVANTGEVVKVKIYTKNPYDIISNIDVLRLLSTRKREIIEETLHVEDGCGELSKPVLRVISTDGCEQYEVVGQKIFSDSCSTISIKYETIYDEYEAVNFSEGTKIVCCAVSEEAVCIFCDGIEGSYKEVITEVDVPSYLLRKRAEKELALLNEKIYNIDVVYRDDFLTPNLRVFMDSKNFLVIQNTIKITAKPLSVKNIFRLIEEVI